MTSQLPLALRWPRRQRFEYFYPGANAAALAVVRRAAEAPDAVWPFVTGGQGSGKTHLLIAACQAATAQGRRAQYVPLASLGANAEAAIRGGVGADVLALDDVQAMAGEAAAEHALFDLYNRARAEGVTLLFASRETPAQLALGLPDLRSRLGACTLATLKPLDEDERRQVLRAHAEARGIRLDDAVLDWLFTHQARDLGALHDLLERIDVASLAAHRRITIPFLRDFLRHNGTSSHAT
ncbi:MAG TPA: DnaA regulatory inactivator Hda [Oleiagrimonas sp.]|nr:DnaA regulatory inactivator Hda [Oleiagrimonas sp.]